jgi:peptidoglycan/xylan/chitin deacetylase (PgdA/CDA1 family)
VFRALLKSGLARALSATGVTRAYARLSGAAGRPLVIGYHRVVEDFDAAARESIPAMLISSRMLEAHLDWIGKRYSFVSLDDLAGILESGITPRKPVAAVTFDDGYRDVYDHALPLLRRKGIPAGVFLVTELTGTSRIPLHDHLYLLLHRAERLPSVGPAEVVRMLRRLEILDRGLARSWARAKGPFGRFGVLYESLPQDDLLRLVAALQERVEIEEAELEPFRLLSWEMARALLDAGITVGSHTRTHSLLTHERPAHVLEELAGSRREIRENLGIEAFHLAYPAGCFSSSVVSAAASAGYRYGYVTCPHRDADSPLLTIPRRLLWENACRDSRGRFSPSILSCQASSLLDLAAPCRGEHAVSASPSPAPAPEAPVF